MTIVSLPLRGRGRSGSRPEQKILLQNISCFSRGFLSNKLAILLVEAHHGGCLLPHTGVH